MKHQKLINELNSHLDSINKYQRKRKEQLKVFLDQFKTEEQILRAKLKKEESKSNRKQLKKELNMVKQAYALLG